MTLSRQGLDRLNSCCYEGAVLITALLPCHEDFRIIGDHLFRVFLVNVCANTVQMTFMATIYFQYVIREINV
jgi:hypothetical protein